MGIFVLNFERIIARIILGILIGLFEDFCGEFVRVFCGDFLWVTRLGFEVEAFFFWHTICIEAGSVNKRGLRRKQQYIQQFQWLFNR